MSFSLSFLLNDLLVRCDFLVVIIQPLGPAFSQRIANEAENSNDIAFVLYTFFRFSLLFC